MKARALLLALALLLLLVYPANGQSAAGGAINAIRSPQPPQDRLQVLCVEGLIDGWLPIKTCYYIKQARVNAAEALGRSLPKKNGPVYTSGPFD
jgi:hypothetical protein